MTDRGSVLVTGASKGLGAVIARRLAATGRPVAVNYRSDAEGAARAVADIRDAGGVAEAYAADVTDEARVEELVDRVVADLGPVDVLVLNATGPQPAVALDELTWQDHLDQLTFFVKSPTLLARSVVPSMRARGFGRIIHIGSDIFERGLPGMSAYVAAKGAQHGLMRSWSRELGPAGITVNVVAPGWIPVERHQDASDDELAAYLAEVPVPRVGVPEDVAEAVAYLAADTSGFINGQRLTVNGGHSTD